VLAKMKKPGGGFSELFRAISKKVRLRGGGGGKGDPKRQGGLQARGFLGGTKEKNLLKSSKKSSRSGTMESERVPSKAIGGPRKTWGGPLKTRKTK